MKISFNPNIGSMTTTGRWLQTPAHIRLYLNLNWRLLKSSFFFTKKIGARRVTGGLDSNEEGEEVDEDDGMLPDLVFSMPA